MLPFLDKKKIIGSVISSRKGKSDLEVKTEVQAPGSDIDPGLMAAAEDMMRAFEAKSVIDMAKALKAAFMVCEADPEDEAAE